MNEVGVQDPGRMLSHYRLVEKIGEGGMGVVWKVHDEKLDRTVALKVLKPELVGDEEHRQRFLREARSAAAVDHPFIASVHDADEVDGTLFIAMEFVEGQTLRALLSKGPIPIADAQRYATEIAEGLATAHQTKLVHRDLKPDNVMVAKTGHAKILDFGLAKVVEKLDEAATLTLGAAEPVAPTTAGAILGTPAYMSPEQARGEPVDSRSDIFSFGSTVYEMVTGKAPFQRETYTDTLASILRDEPLTPHDSNPTIPGELSRIISRCLHKKPDDRYNDTRDLVAALKDLQAVPTAQTPPQPLQVQHRKLWRRLVAGITAVAAIVALAVVQPWKYAQAPDAPSVRASSSMTDRPNWILLAEFEGPKDEPSLAIATREVLSASLEQSALVTPIAVSALKRGLELCGKQADTRIQGDVARELAIRAAARLYVEGRIDRLGSQYSIVFRAFDAEEARLVAIVQGTAKSDDSFLPALGRLAWEFIAELSKSSEVTLPTRTPLEVLTPSLEAYQLYAEANELHADGQFASSNTLLQRATELDPGFAAAHLRMRVNYSNLGMRDSAEVALQRALQNTDRLTEHQRIELQYTVAFWRDYDLVEALRYANLLVRQSPSSASAQGTRAFILACLGRYEEALDGYIRANVVSPFEPKQIYLNSQFRYLMALGRNEEAAGVALELRGRYKKNAHLMQAVYGDDWAEVERLATEYSQDPTTNSVLRCDAKLALISLETMSGRVSYAFAELQRLLENSPDCAPSICSAHIPFWVVSSTTQLPPACDDTTTSNLILRGIWDAIRGDAAHGHKQLQAISARSLAERRRFVFDIKLLECWLLASEGRWRAIPEVLERYALDGQEIWLGRLPVRWLIAEAYDQIEQPKKAAEYFELVVSPMRLSSFFLSHEYEQRAAYKSFAHHRLVLLYSKMGRVEDARRHWEIFEKSFTNPDAELVPMIEEARQALAAAEAKS